MLYSEIKATAQYNLFEPDKIGLTVGEVALDIGVSPASVRNWIKAGHLVLDERKLVTQASLIEFRNRVVGKEKLTCRANKTHLAPARSLKAFDPKEFLTESLSHEYENSLSAAFKNREGIFYTPELLADDFFSALPEDKEDLTFCDPCCGSGQFLMAAIRNGFSPKNVYGFDTDANAVKIAKQRLAQFKDFQESNIITTDFLQEVVLSEKPQINYDVIFTNPPWGKKLQKVTRERIGKSLDAGRSLDTCSLFFFAALKNLNVNGFCGFLLPESFFNIALFEKSRRFALSMKILSIVDYGRVFPGLLTKAIGITIIKTETEPASTKIFCSEFNNKSSHERDIQQFRQNPNAIMNFSVTAEEATTLSHMLSFPHITLKGRARWGLGIVTGNNARFICDRPMPNCIPVWRGSDITADGLKPPSIYIPDKLSLYQQVAPLELYRSPEKLIYKFISNRLVFFHDTEQRFILNSANMMIPNEIFNTNQKYLQKYLNSKLVNWFFKSVFGTHKILRSDIECIPIFSEFIINNQDFDELALCKYLGIKEIEGGTYRII